MKSFLKHSLPWVLLTTAFIAAWIIIILLHPGFSEIDYSGVAEQAPAKTENGEYTLCINEGTRKIHLPDCRYAVTISESKKRIVTVNDVDAYLEELEEMGYSACKVCLRKTASEENED